jgi:hypothetical protein
MTKCFRAGSVRRHQVNARTQPSLPPAADAEALTEREIAVIKLVTRMYLFHLNTPLLKHLLLGFTLPIEQEETSSRKRKHDQSLKTQGVESCSSWVQHQFAEDRMPEQRQWFCSWHLIPYNRAYLMIPRRMGED